MTTSNAARIRIDVLPNDPDDIYPNIREGLLQSPRFISPKYFYDDVGSRLFERICRLPEYYQTRTEEAMLKTIAEDLIAVTGAEDLIELGSGAATKTRVLLDAMNKAGTLRRYVPFDVSEGILRRVADELAEEYPKLQIHGIVGDFTGDLGSWREEDRELVIFLGGTIGNFSPTEADRFLSTVADQLKSGDYFLIGADLIKNVDVLHAAYNDSAGITAAFNKNALAVLNKLLGGNFNLKYFEHNAFFNTEKHRIEMWLRSRRQQVISLPRIDLEFTMEKDEQIRTEISTKFSPEHLRDMLKPAGFNLTKLYTDPKELFALALAQKR